MKTICRLVLAIVAWAQHVLQRVHNREIRVTEMAADKLQYKITVLSLNFSQEIPISAAEFEELRSAKQYVMFGLVIEEKIDLVLENYFELERYLLNIALEHMTFPGRIEGLLDDSVLSVNRHITNLLTTTRLYLDQVLHEFSSTYNAGSDNFNAIKAYTNDEYDSRLGYRVMEALRNHVQHHSLPTHGISFPMSRVDRDSGSESRLKYSVISYANISYFEDNPKFKKSVLSELAEIADKKNYVAIMPLIREYIESLGCIHEKIRKLIMSDILAADEHVQKIRNMAEIEFNASILGLAAVSYHSNGVYAERIHLTDRPIIRRHNLEAKNRYLDSISRRFVSTEV